MLLLADASERQPHSSAFINTSAREQKLKRIKLVFDALVLLLSA